MIRDPAKHGVLASRGALCQALDSPGDMKVSLNVSTGPNATSGKALEHRAPIDWAKVESWADQISRNDLLAVRETFQSFGAGGPEIVWAPSIDQIEQPTLRSLFTYWSGLASHGSIPLASQIDPIEMRPALGYVMLLEVMDGGRDFRYRVFGTEIAAVSEFDMTGHLLSEHRASAYIVEFALAVYRAAYVRGRSVLTEHWPSQTRQTASWQRLILPLASVSGGVVRFLAGTVPLNHSRTIVRARF